MRRRNLLSTLGTATALGLAGCLTGGSDDETPGSGSATPSQTDTATPSPTETRQPYLYNVEFSTEVGCDVETVDGGVSVDEDAGTITVTGSLQLKDPCYELQLTRATNQDGTFGLTVDSRWSTPDEGSCESCDAVGTFTVVGHFTDGLPESVGLTTVNAGERSHTEYDVGGN